MTIADIFWEEVTSIHDAARLQAYIVYGPLTVSMIEKMARRGGKALGAKIADGPLFSESIIIFVAVAPCV